MQVVHWYRTNFGGILHHSARLRKQKTLKILGFVLCVEDNHKLAKTQFLIQSPWTNWRPCWQKRRDFKLPKNLLLMYQIQFTTNLLVLNRMFSGEQHFNIVPQYCSFEKQIALSNLQATRTNCKLKFTKDL
jgi:hypothetical protein